MEDRLINLRDDIGYEADDISHEDNVQLVPSKDSPAWTLKGIIDADTPTTPLLVFPADIWHEVMYLAESWPSREWAIFLALKDLHSEKPQWLVMDWFMPKQKASSGEVSIDSQDSERYFEDLKRYPYYATDTHRHIAHLHSHHSLGCFFSSVDDAQQLGRKDLGFYDDYRIYVVVTAKGEVKASFVQYRPVLYRTECAIAVTYAYEERNGLLTRERKKEIFDLRERQMEKPAVKYTKPAVPYGYGSYSYGSNTCWSYSAGTFKKAETVAPEKKCAEAPTAPAKNITAAASAFTDVDDDAWDPYGHAYDLTTDGKYDGMVSLAEHIALTYTDADKLANVIKALAHNAGITHDVLRARVFNLYPESGSWTDVMNSSTPDDELIRATDDNPLYAILSPGAVDALTVVHTLLSNAQGDVVPSPFDTEAVCTLGDIMLEGAFTDAELKCVPPTLAEILVRKEVNGNDTRADEFMAELYKLAKNGLAQEKAD